VRLILLPASVDDNVVTCHSAEHPPGLPPYAGWVEPVAAECDLVNAQPCQTHGDCRAAAYLNPRLQAMRMKPRASEPKCYAAPMLHDRRVEVAPPRT
jgi:hypothetical protein